MLWFIQFFNRQLFRIRWKNAENITESTFPKDKLKKIIVNVDNNGKDLSDEDVDRLLDEYIKDSFELSVTKNSGRIHGFIFTNVFHIVWFDPAHNLFPGTDKKGKINKTKLIAEFGTVKAFCAEEFNRLKDDNKKLRLEYEEIVKHYDELFDYITEPNWILKLKINFSFLLKQNERCEL